MRDHAFMLSYLYNDCDVTRLRVLAESLHYAGVSNVSVIICSGTDFT